MFFYRKFLLVFFVLIIIPIVGFSHGESHKDKEKLANKEVQIEQNNETHKTPIGNSLKTNQTPDNFKISDLMNDLKKFPSLHPMVIHFPIVLLLIALPIWLIGLRLGSLELKITAVVLNTFGFVGAVAAAFILHPHIDGMSVQAKATLGRHEFLAYLTVFVSGASAIIGIIFITGKYYLKRIKFVEWLIAGLMAISILTVSLAGHFGATLTHLQLNKSQIQNQFEKH